MRRMSDLKLSVNDGRVRMSNANIQLVLNAEGKADSLIFHGQELLENLKGEKADPDAQHTFYCDYHVKGKTVNIKPNKLVVIEDSTDRIHVAYIDDVSQLGVAYHFILPAKDDAIYSYVKAWNNTQSMIKVDEFRTVYRLNHDLFYLGKNHERIGYQPTSAHMISGSRIQDETYELDDGSLYSNSKIYSKYDYAGYFKENDFWGQFGHEYGFWFIPANRSYYDGGPLNQDLLLHYDGLILNYMASSHLGKDQFKIPVGWSKVYGPWCLYLNEGKNKIKDAQIRAKKEQANWPYQWVNETGYFNEAVTIKGKIKINQQLPKDQLQLVLSQACSNNDFLKVQDGYSFDAVTNKQGDFVLEKVRPGNYVVYVYSIGGKIVGTYKLADKQVTGESIQDWGTLNWRIKETKTIWQIGESTHTTAGFKFSDQLRNYIWQDSVPANYDFEIGAADNDWYYLQNDHGVWKITFSGQFSEKSSKDYELILAFAGETQKDMQDKKGITVRVAVNDREAQVKSFVNDKAAYRSALRSGSYGLMKVKIARDSLKPNSENTIRISTNGYLLYDTLLLTEAD